MSTTTPQERMAIARAAKAERASKAVEQKRAVESQKKPPTPASTLDSIPQESSMSEEYSSEEEEPPRSTQKRKREITVEDFIPEPVAPKKKKIKINAAPVTPVSWKYSLADMVSSTLPVLGQLTLLAAGVVASVALRMLMCRIIIRQCWKWIIIQVTQRRILLFTLLVFVIPMIIRLFNKRDDRVSQA